MPLRTRSRAALAVTGLAIGVLLTSTPAWRLPKVVDFGPANAAYAQPPDSVATPTWARQLLVDDNFVERKSAVRRELGRPEKLNGGRPLLSEARFYGTVLRDEDRFKLWYRKPGAEGYGYAESSDGVQFEKKGDVTGVPFAGDYTLAVEIDSRESDPAHRYKAAFDAPGMAAGLAGSADGLRWTPYNQGKPVTKRAADSYNQVLWDPLARTYRLFTRTDFGSAGGDSEIRGTRSMTNPDVKSRPTDWKTVSEWIFDRDGKEESRRRQIYAATCWIHERVYFALLTVYEYPGDVSEGRATDHEKRHERDVMNFYIATSRDGVAWDFQWVYAGRPLVPRGSDGAFDKDILFPASTIVTHGERHWLYYCGGNERHGTEQTRFDRELKIGVATLPRDRFVALESVGDETGEVVTKPFPWDGRGVALNIDARGGSATIELLDAATQEPFRDAANPGVARVTDVDSLQHRVEWPAGAATTSLRGKDVRLRIRLRHAKLYAIQPAT